MINYRAETLESVELVFLLSGRPLVLSVLGLLIVVESGLQVGLRVVGRLSVGRQRQFDLLGTALQLLFLILSKQVDQLLVRVLLL